jgi:hypothetical protein
MNTESPTCTRPGLRCRRARPGAPQYALPMGVGDCSTQGGLAACSGRVGAWDPPAASKHRPARPVVREVASIVTLQAKCTQGPGAGWPDPPGVSQEVPTMAGSCSQGPSLQGPTGRAPKIKPARPAGAVARLHTPESGSAGRPSAPGGAILMARLSPRPS